MLVAERTFFCGEFLNNIFTWCKHGLVKVGGVFMANCPDCVGGCFMHALNRGFRDTARRSCPFISDHLLCQYRLWLCTRVLSEAGSTRNDVCVAHVRKLPQSSAYNVPATYSANVPATEHAPATVHATQQAPAAPDASTADVSSANVPASDAAKDTAAARTQHNAHYAAAVRSLVWLRRAKQAIRAR